MTGTREDPQRASLQPQDRHRGVHVAVPLEDRKSDHGSVRVDLEDLASGHEPESVEVVHAEVPEDPPGDGDVFLVGWLRVVSGHSHHVQRTQVASDNELARRAVSAVEPALESHLENDAGGTNVIDHPAGRFEVQGDGLLAERRQARVGGGVDELRVRRARRGDHHRVDIRQQRVHRRNPSHPQLTSRVLGPVDVNIRERHSFDLRVCPQGGGVDHADPTDPDHPDAHPWFPGPSDPPPRQPLERSRPGTFQARTIGWRRPEVKSRSAPATGGIAARRGEGNPWTRSG